MDTIKVERKCANCKHWQRDDAWVRKRYFVKDEPARFLWLFKTTTWGLGEEIVGEAAMCTLNPEWVDKLGTSFCGHYEQFRS